MVDYLGGKILKQWEASRPKMVAKLKKAGDLEEAVVWAQEQAKTEQAWLIKRGTPWWSAEEIALAPWMFPDETEQKTLTQDQMPFLPSA
jgi:hypothetical protein